ncbi:MAG: twin-arginine translocase subunit TatC [Bacteroidota bacterium]
MKKREKNTKNNEKEGGSMSFWNHLEELRGHLVRSVIAIFLLGIVAFIGKDILFDYVILAPKEPYFFTNRVFCWFADRFSAPALCINQNPVEIINIELAGQFKTHIIVSLISGLIVSFPYILYEFWSFVRPALHPREKANSRGAVFVTSFLFLLGVSFSYFIIAPLTINFLGSYQVSNLVANQIALRSYITTVTMVTFATGIVFELPVIVYFLSRVGLLTPEFMKKNRKVAFILIITLSALITPPDIFSQILVGIPLYVLYEVSIRISRKVNKELEQEMNQ